MFVLWKKESIYWRKWTSYAKYSQLFYSSKIILQKYYWFNWIFAGENRSWPYVYHMWKQKSKRFSIILSTKKTYDWQRSYFYENWWRIWVVLKILWFFYSVWTKTKIAIKGCPRHLISKSESFCKWSWLG